MVKVIPFKCFYPVSLTEFALPIIYSDVDVPIDVKGIDEEDTFKIPANILTSDYKRVFQEILTLGHARKYEALSRHWTSYEALGFFREEEEELFYIYRMEYTLNNQHYQQTGLLCLLELDKKSILGHENTIDEKTNDQIKRLETYRTSISPVFLLYKDYNSANEVESSHDPKLSINELFEKASFSFPIIDLFASNDVRHTIWKVSDLNLTKEIIERFNEIKKIYIADGHHRVESSFVLRDKLKEANPNHVGNESYNYILSAVFPLSQVHILEYNRLLKNVKKFKKEIIPKLQVNFDVEEISEFEKPTENGTFVIYNKKRWFKVKAKKILMDRHKDNLVKHLDSYIIQEYVFKDIFNIKNVRKSHKIAYVPGSKPIDYLAEITDNEHGAAFILPAIKKSDIISIADNNKIIPPKTTWFEPKILKGIMYWKF